MTAVVLIRNAEVDGRLADVTWRDGVIADVVAAGSPHLVTMPKETSVVNADGGALIPGLHDHHVHLHALAAARASLQAGPPAIVTVDDLASRLRRAVASAPGRWIRAVGYHESVAGELDAEGIDRLVPEASRTPIRIQHRSGQLWILNRCAVDVAGVASWADEGVERDARGGPTGRVFGLDTELRDRVPPVELDMPSLGAELASYGVTGVTDMTPTASSATIDRLERATSGGEFPVRVTVSGDPLLPRDAGRELARGPVKLLPTDQRDPDLDAISRGVVLAHEANRPVAIHCVTRVGLIVALEAWRRAGVRPGDRIEHGAVIPDELIPTVKSLGLLVVTQPNFVAERGDRYLVDVGADDLAHLWRARTLIDRGVAVAGGTDAPFGHPDPWRAIAAAVRRTTPAGIVLGPDDRLSPANALALFLGSADQPQVPRRLVPGARTDVCLLDRPLSHALAEPSAAFVRMTIGRHGLQPR